MMNVNHRTIIIFLGQKMKQTEHQIQAQFFRMIRLWSLRHPILDIIFAIPNGGARDKITGARLKAEGVKRGVSDVFCPSTNNKISHGLFIEFKTVKGKLTHEQIYFSKYIQQLGYQFIVCRSAEEAIDAVQRFYGINLS
jgi:hypothetical protein